jgi:hypothetical protein
MKVLGPFLDLVNKQAKNLADGSSPTDAVTKQQLDAAIRGLDWKSSVRAASTANINIASPGASIDGVAFNVNDSFLAKDQTDATQNGLWTWNGAAVAATRRTDADVNAEVTSGLAVAITEGTVNADRMYVLGTNDPIVVGTTALTFVQLGGSSAPYTAGNGLQLSGQQFSVLPDPAAGSGITVSGTGVKVDTSVVVRKYASNVGDGAATVITKAHGLGTADVMVQVRDAATGEVVYPDIAVDATNIVLTFSAAPANNAYRVIGQA